MPEEENKSELKSEIAQHKPRDEEGHFVHVDPHSNPSHPSTSSNTVSQFFSEHTRYSKSKDDLLDVHIGNPLWRITKLLEDIKKQKAFSFTLKGSLGVMGVFLALSVFGILGGGKILCDKGVRTEIGTIKTLHVQEKEPAGLPILSNILDWFNPQQTHNRVVLVKENEEVVKIPFSKEVDITKYANYPVYPEQSRRVIATGNYDSCSQTLTITDPTAIEIYFRTRQ